MGDLKKFRGVISSSSLGVKASMGSALRNFDFKILQRNEFLHSRSSKFGRLLNAFAILLREVTIPAFSSNGKFLTACEAISQCSYSFALSSTLCLNVSKSSWQNGSLCLKTKILSSSSLLEICSYFSLKFN